MNRKEEAKRIRDAYEAKRKACKIPFTEEEWHLWEDVCEEEYTIPLIKKYLRSPQQKQMLEMYDLSIEDCLNGRYGGSQEVDIQQMYDDWNKKLGMKQFGF